MVHRWMGWGYECGKLGDGEEEKVAIGGWMSGCEWLDMEMDNCWKGMELRGGSHEGVRGVTEGGYGGREEEGGGRERWLLLDWGGICG